MYTLSEVNSSQNRKPPDLKTTMHIELVGHAIWRKLAAAGFEPATCQRQHPHMSLQQKWYSK